jgi:sialate O-acetylesterase
MTATVASATVTLPHFMTSNMVVQRNTAMTINGTATPGADVTVQATWGKGGVIGKAQVAADGHFAVTVKTPDAGGPYTLTFDDDNGEALRLTNILSGEVWVCSGQSNMEMSINSDGLMNGPNEAVIANNPDVRLLQLKKGIAYSEHTDCEVSLGGWTEANPSTVSGFSSIAYLYGRNLQQALGVPVGVIETCWGGTTAEAWTPYKALKEIPGFETSLGLLEKCSFDDDKVNQYAQQQLASIGATIADGGCPYDPAHYNTSWSPIEVPSYWETQGYPTLDGLAIIQHEINVPADKAGLPLTLNLGYIDDEDATYFNGTLVGSTLGCNMQRLYTVDGSLVKTGKNVISIRIRDYGGPGGSTGTQADYYVRYADGSREELGGKWQFHVLADLVGSPELATSMSVGSNNFPSCLYNAMIHPLTALPIQGVIWYQGESNVGRPQQYSDMFKAMITSWRERWHRKDMPFYFVQIAAMGVPVTVQPESGWAHLRQAQANALELPSVGMVTAVDLGHPTDIHPKNKQEVARRLSDMALERTYGLDGVGDAPRPVSTRFVGHKVVIRFDKELVARSCAIQGFIIAGSDGRFVQGQARLSANNELEISTPEVKTPTIVRYLWADYPYANLYGTNGLPVLPFATDNGGIK